MINCKEGRV